MKKKMQIFCSLLAMCLMGVAHAAISDLTKPLVQKLGAAKATELTHKAGQSKLTENELQEIRRTVQEAKALGQVDLVRVISWADREYPTAGQKASDADVKLAEDRAKNIKDYIEDKLNISSVTTYNMAKRPNSVQEILDTNQAQVKERLEASGAAPGEKETGLLNWQGKSKDSLVLVYVK